VRDLELMIALGAETLAGGAHSTGHAAGTLDVAKATARHQESKWVPPIQKCVASKKQGIVEVLEKLEQHRAWLGTRAGLDRQKQRSFAELTGLLRDTLARETVRALSGEVALLAERVSRREIDPYTACELLIEKFKNIQ
jgi:LAO/AO transport system kinase